MTKIGMLMCAFALVSASLFAAEELTGSDYVRMGTLGTVSGSLVKESDEWFLKSSKESYALHLGNYEVMYPQGIGLKEGSQAEVRGFIYEDHISPVRISSSGETWNFRDEQGKPAWSGKGRGKNRTENEGTGSVH